MRRTYDRVDETDGRFDMRKKSQVESPLVKMVKEAEDGYAYRCINGLVVIQSWEMHDGKEGM
jgi:hypothetical protein